MLYNTTTTPFSRSQAASPKFGCRLFAYTAPNRHANQPKVLKQLFLDGGNSMKRQSLLPLREVGDTTVTYQDNTTERGYDGVTKAGWGFAYANPDGDKVTITKSAQPPYQDANFDPVVEHIASQQPQTVLGHLREAFSSKGIYHTTEAHPFAQGDWALIHNGSIPEETILGMQEELETRHTKDSKSPLPESDVDSEKVACLLSDTLRQATGSPNIKELDTSTVRNLFKQVATDVIRWPDKTGAKPEKVEDYPGSFNFMVSDGERIFATRYGKIHRLNVGEQPNKDGETDFLLATDPIQPTKDSGLPKIRWTEIPHNSLITLEKRTGVDGKSFISYQQEPLLVDKPPMPKAKSMPAFVLTPHSNLSEEHKAGESGKAYHTGLKKTLSGKLLN